MAAWEQRLAELRVRLKQFQYETERIAGQRRVLLYWHELGTGHSDQAGSLGPLHDPDEAAEFIAGLGLEDPVADHRVYRVSGAEQVYQVACVGKANAASLRELAAISEP